MSDWSVWSVCSCVSQRQQQYRVALSPAIRGQQCTHVETQSRACSLGQCDGELKSMLTKMYCILSHSIFFVLCFSLMGFQWVAHFYSPCRPHIHPDCSNSPRSFRRSTGPNWKRFLQKPLKCIWTNKEASQMRGAMSSSFFQQSSCLST